MKESSATLLRVKDHLLTLASLRDWLIPAYRAMLLGSAEAFVRATIISDETLTEEELYQLTTLADSLHEQALEAVEAGRK